MNKHQLEKLIQQKKSALIKQYKLLKEYRISNPLLDEVIGYYDKHYFAPIKEEKESLNQAITNLAKYLKDNGHERDLAKLTSRFRYSKNKSQTCNLQHATKVLT